MAQVQRMSRLMVKTLRDDPADAETLNHKLLVRAGYVRRNAAGVISRTADRCERVAVRIRSAESTR